MNEELHGNPHYTLGRFLGLASSIRSGSSVGFILKEILVIEKEYLEGKERNKAAYWQDIPAVKLGQRTDAAETEAQTAEKNAPIYNWPYGGPHQTK